MEVMTINTQWIPLGVLKKMSRKTPKFKHPAELTKEEAAAFKKPMIIRYKDNQYMVMRVENLLYEYNYMDNLLGKSICNVNDVDYVRGCSGFDF